MFWVSVIKCRIGRKFGFMPSCICTYKETGVNFGTGGAGFTTTLRSRGAQYQENKILITITKILGLGDFKL